MLQQIKKPLELRMSRIAHVGLPFASIAQTVARIVANRDVQQQTLVPKAIVVESISTSKRLAIRISRIERLSTGELPRWRTGRSNRLVLPMKLRSQAQQGSADSDRISTEIIYKWSCRVSTETPTFSVEPAGNDAHCSRQQVFGIRR